MLKERILTAISTLGTFAVLCSAGAGAQVKVTTFHNDIARTGQNTKETILTRANVNVNQFGKLFTVPVDGMIVGQPLYLSGVSIPGAGTHNVVYVTTQHDSVYAFDADSNTGANAEPLWHTSFTDPSAGVTSVPIAQQACSGVTGFTEIGIVATPVINATTGTLFVIAKTLENGAFVHRLHALDVTTGQEKLGGPVTITASVTFNGQLVSFEDKHQMARPGLLLSKGVLYVSFGSLGCIMYNPFHGWVMAYDAITLRQLGVFNTDPDQTSGDGVWQGGSGPASDGTSIYFATSDGAFSAPVDFGDSVLKLTLSSGALVATDYFTPSNQGSLRSQDLDVGSGGVVLLPDQSGLFPHLLVSVGKEGTVYLINRDNMGHFKRNGNNSQIVESFSGVGEIHVGPAYWNNTLYFAGSSMPIMAYQVSAGQISTSPFTQSTLKFGGTSPSISSNGTANGILWIIHGGSSSGLFAYSATNLSKMLYNSHQNSERDTLGPVTHFATPTIANGKVYVGGTQQLTVFGLLSNLSAASRNRLFAVPRSAANVETETPAP